MRRNAFVKSLASIKGDRTLFGNYAAQSFLSFGLYEKLLADRTGVRMNWICEIGTQRGMTSLFLALHAYFMDIPFLTVDIRRQYGMHTANLLETIGARVETADCFADPSVVDEFIPISPGLLFCDGGDKAKEVQRFAPRVRPGSIIVVHDWGTEVQEDAMPWEIVCKHEPWHGHSMSMGTRAGILRKMYVSEKYAYKAKQKKGE